MKKTIFWLLTVYVILLLLFSVSMVTVHAIPHWSIEPHIRTSVRALLEEGKYPSIMEIPIFRIDTFTDALMLNLAWCADEHNPQEAAFSNLYYTDSGMNVFERTQDVVNGRGASDGFFYPYARYWHGSQVVLRPLLMVTDYYTIRLWNIIVFSVVLLLCLWTICRHLSASIAFLFLLSLALVGLPVIPQCIQFSVCFYLALFSIFIILMFPGLTANLLRTSCVFFAIGGLTAFFDLLTTPIVTLAFPLTICLLVHTSWQSSRHVTRFSLVWLSGYISLWLSKCILSQLLTEYDIVDSFLNAAMVRSATGVIGLWQTLSQMFGNTLVTSLSILMVVVVLLVIALATSCWLRFRHHGKVLTNGWLLTIALVVPLWHLLFIQHSIVHFWFTWRTLSVCMFALFLFVYLITHPRNEKDCSTYTVL